MNEKLKSDADIIACIIASVNVEVRGDLFKLIAESLDKTQNAYTGTMFTMIASAYGMTDE